MLISAHVRFLAVKREMAVSNLEELLDIELFNGEVEKYPEIWNVAAEEYHNRAKKRSAWINVCRVFCEGFDEKDERDKNEICNTLTKKWRNIKDNFLKSLRKKTTSGQAADSGRRYIYAQQLSFLQQAGATTDTQSSLGVDDEQDNRELSEESNPTPKEGSEYNRPPRYDHNSRKRKRDLESSLIDFMKAPLPSSTVTAVPEPNADRSFFESILPFVSGFTENQKLEFRCEVLNIIRRMRIPQQNTSHINLPPQQRYTGYPTYQSPPNLLSSPAPHCSNYLPQTPSHQSSTRIPELQPRPPPAPLSQAPSPGRYFQPVSPSTSSSTFTEIQPYADEDSLQGWLIK